LKQRYFIIVFLSLLLNLRFSGISAQAFVVNGSASAVGGDCYQITPDAGGLTGSIFSQNPIDLTQPFSIDATMFFGCKDGNGADGIVFILATTNTALGGAGGGIGYQGITPSIAVEYDDYFNGNFGDPTSDHVAVISMGSVDHTMPTGLVAPMNLSNIEDCMDHCFLATWDPVTQTLTSTLDDNTITYTGDIVATIFNGNPQVYYGFSSGTGSLSNTHRVCFGPPELEAMPDVSVCESESIELQADPNGVDWRWAPNPTLSDYDISNPIATPTSTTTYTVIIEYPCGYLGYDTVVVALIPSPVAEATNDGPVCEGESLSLEANGGTGYEWSGPMGYTSFLQDPTINNIMAGNAGIYTVTVTDAAGCTATASTLVDVDTGPVIDIDPPPTLICEDFDPIQLTASPGGGIWSGEISPGGLFDPGYAGEGVHFITYTVTNANGCSNTEEIAIEVFVVPEVLIDPPGILCEESGPIQLTGSPPGGIWTGEITLGGIFDPGDAGEGPHLITYTANDGNGCTNSAEIVIEVVPGVTADIFPAGPFCITDSLIQLTGSPGGGIWGGAANPLGIIFPGNLGVGYHVVTYELTDQNGCYYGQEDIEIVAVPDVSIDPTPPLCSTLPPIIMSASPAGGVWSGVADPSGQVNPSLLGPGNHQVIYTLAFPGGCSNADTLDVIVLPNPPQVNNLNTTCDSLASSYIVSFTMNGGDPLTYSVTGSATGTIIPGNPYIFTSMPIQSGDPYNFIVSDANRCDSTIISGSFTCNCGTNAGMMDLNLNTACKGDTINILPPAGVVLDPDDSLVYVLHHGFPDSIILISASNSFVFGPPLQTGITYFVSSVVGNALPGSGVDFTDPCLSVSFGTPVMWIELPAGYLTGPSAICKGDSASMSFILSGNGPFDVGYSDGSAIYTVSNIVSGHSLYVKPSSSTTYTLQDVIDLSTPGCRQDPDTGILIEVFDVYLVQQDEMICAGDSILLGGDFQTNTGNYFDTLSTINGCDSVIETLLMVLLPDTTFLDDASCDSAQIGTFINVYTNQMGCDSTTITTVAYVLSDTTTLTSGTCDFQQAGTFTEYFTGQSGCDSVVIETITFIPSDTTLLTGETCDAAAAGTFTQILTNTGGCDSLVIETIQLSPSDTTSISGETCYPSEAGTFIQLLTNAAGCDSMIIETITLLPSDTAIAHHITCLPQDTGTVMQVYTNIYGCDSLQFSITTIAPEDSCVTIRKDVFIPNVFSPNGDGINDLFLVFSKQEVVANLPYVRIFDRWGGLVFERFDIQPNTLEQSWDGTERGEPLGPGVFVYVVYIEYSDGTEEARTGDITLIR
jgi:gliding motility-associated-like protein